MEVGVTLLLILKEIQQDSQVWIYFQDKMVILVELMGQWFKDLMIMRIGKQFQTQLQQQRIGRH